MAKKSKFSKPENKNNDSTKRKFNIAGGQDLPDTPQDIEKMTPESAVIDLPDVKDIPGQEHVIPAPLGELADSTISSDDEEGVGIFDEESDEPDIVMGNDADVSTEEKNDLETTDQDMPTKDEQNLRQASMDNTDEEGEDLNEQGFGKDISGVDLDVPGTEADDANEQIGEEDEENNPYSTADNDDNDMNR